MTLALTAIIAGLALLVWSADKFVDGAASTARHFGLSPLLIGMIIVGFGTSAPEIVVSVLSALEGNTGLALGNAYGSNITNIALILGVTALINPIKVPSEVIRRELPILVLVTALATWQVLDGALTLLDSLTLLGAFGVIMAWTIRSSLKEKAGGEEGAGGGEEAEVLTDLPLRSAIFWLIAGFALLIVSSRLLVWGAVSVAHALGVSDLIIGLTIVAVGTSLPELASSVIAARKGEHDIALGNVLGSNLFNTLVVVGVAGVVRPMSVDADILSRDIWVMGAVTLLLCALSYGAGWVGRIGRVKGGVLIAAYVAYTVYLISGVLKVAG